MEYRIKHPRCRYCKYNKVRRYNDFIYSFAFFHCTLKDKHLYSDSAVFSYIIKGFFCKWFDPKEN